MKNKMKIIIGLLMAVMLVFTLVGCGGGAPKKTPAEEAAESLDTMLSALKGANVESLNELAGGEDIFADAEEAFGSKESADVVLKAMFGHFDYTIGTPEQVDDSNVNVPVSVTNVDMSKAVNAWITDAMSLAMSDPSITEDEKAFQTKLMGMFGESVEKVASEDGGTVTNDVVFPMTLKDGKWEVSEDVSEDTLDKLLGGMMTAINGISGGM